MKFSAEQVFNPDLNLLQHLGKAVRIEMSDGTFVEGRFVGRYSQPYGKVFLRVNCGYPETEAIRDRDVADGAAVEFF